MSATGMGLAAGDLSANHELDLQCPFIHSISSFKKAPFSVLGSPGGICSFPLVYGDKVKRPYVK